MKVSCRVLDLRRVHREVAEDHRLAGAYAHVARRMARGGEDRHVGRNLGLLGRDELDDAGPLERLELVGEDRPRFCPAPVVLADDIARTRKERPGLGVDRPADVVGVDVRQDHDLDRLGIERVGQPPLCAGHEAARLARARVDEDRRFDEIRPERQVPVRPVEQVGVARPSEVLVGGGEHLGESGERALRVENGSDHGREQ